MSLLPKNSGVAQHAVRRIVLLSFALSAISVSAIQLSSPAAAQDGDRNWMRDYVQLRVLERNLQALRAQWSGPQARQADTQRTLENVLEPKIVGGRDAGPSDNPFQVALLLKAEPDDFDAFYCGGTLVRPDKVVTAAHCSDFVATGQVQVLTNARKLDGSGSRRDITRIAVHPAWDPRSFNNDVAVWTLATPESGQPRAKIATAGVPAGTDLLTTGWGALRSNGPRPIDLQRVEVPKVARSTCNAPSSYDGEVTDTMLCAGEAAGGKDACQGDSGGPLTSGSGFSVLTGITSWGRGCAQANFYGVYTEVALERIRTFIEGQL